MADAARIMAELDPATAAWLATNADPRTWEQVARDAAARAVASLWRWEGEPGHNAALHGVLCGDSVTPAVRAAAAALGCAPAARPHVWWRRPDVVQAVCAWLGLHGAAARRDVAERAGRVLTFSTNNCPGRRHATLVG